MAERPRFQPQTPAPMSGPPRVMGPGEFVREFGRRLGWAISTNNILVEGVTDVAYFQIAARLYEQETKLKLIDDDMAVIAVGDRDRGGTDGLLRYLPVLKDMLPTDPNDRNGRPFRFIVLLDSDSAGKGAARALGSMGFGRNRDVFLLQRAFPRDTRDPREFQTKCDRLNVEWSSLECEIEDLVERSVLDAFVSDNPGACQRKPAAQNGAHHYDWHGHIKPALSRFVGQNALLPDVQQVVDLLQSLRYMLELDPAGS